MSISRFSVLKPSTPDAIFALVGRFNLDNNPNKINLAIGAYKDENQKPWVLPSVKLAKKIILNDPNDTHEYNPMIGIKSFTNAGAKLILGDDSPILKNNAISSVQSIGGTGALKLGFELLKRAKPSSVYISNPTWANHVTMIPEANLPLKYYRYWDTKNLKIDFKGFMDDLWNAPDNSTFLLHACGHNPTGIDPTKEQWKEIAEVMKKKNHFPFFDCAYQGFASGNIINDSWAIRYFADQGFEMLVSQSFSKNMGLYGERVGCLHVIYPKIKNTEKVVKLVNDHLASITRSFYSNAPSFGAKIAEKILTQPDLRQQWYKDMATMSGRIGNIRKELSRKLKERGTPGQWDHFSNQIGMFSYSGLTEKQVIELNNKYSIYFTKNGRVSISGLNMNNIDYFVDSVDKVVRTIH
ncbi:PLP-dependent transferase [Piromyces finnis]|uniref:Aspartate aminotransferase n=1 Tax=Piromyces finnis TaxID=1754191 RepID=A0A1Y1V3H5_9FUNG|nr:PLP-dependent transferase [Piromyces finnis]|eukprot:ORX45624.1 PLP-dependent transferase [Piromyces finnis]